jgi:hypothetical protein
MSAERYIAIRDAELGQHQTAMPEFRWTDAAALLDELVLADQFPEFLTLEAYSKLG